MNSTVDTIRLEEVRTMPKVFLPGVLYVSYEFATASHLCCCGCGTRVVTPLGPGRWNFIQENGGPSLSPSIGNTSQSCRSHYFIRNGQVHWAQEMTDEEHLLAITADRKNIDDVLSQRINFWVRLKIWFWKMIKYLRFHR